MAPAILQRSRPFLALGLLALALLAAAPPSARATPLAAVPILFASEEAAPPPKRWSIGRLFSGLNSRARVVQFALVLAALALFILMKKWTE